MLIAWRHGGHVGVPNLTPLGIAFNFYANKTPIGVYAGCVGQYYSNTKFEWMPTEKIFSYVQINVNVNVTISRSITNIVR